MIGGLIHRRSHRDGLVIVASVIGGCASGVAALASWAQSVGATPAALFRANRAWSSLIRVGAIPVELIALVWFVAVGVLSSLHQTHRAQSLAPVAFLTATPLIGFGLWFTIARPGTCWVIVVATAAATVVLVAAGVSQQSWPTNFVRAVISDIGVLASSPRGLAWTAGFLAVPLLLAAIIRTQVGRVDDPFGLDLRRWYVAQEPLRRPELASDNKIRVVVFTDYQSSDRYAVPEAAAEIDAYRKQGLSAELVVRDFPLDNNCNSAHAAIPHTAACEAACAVRLVRAVQGQADADNMAMWLYRRGPVLSPELVERRLQDLGLLEQYRLRRSTLLEEVAADAQLGRSLGIRGTPTFVVNGVRLPMGNRILTRILRYEQERRKTGRGVFPRPAPGL